jgi:glycosyltransferase involved in cell wall biosynthesis
MAVLMQVSAFGDIGDVIPAYRPDRKLIGLVTDLAEFEFRVIIVVDDGSGTLDESLFAELSQIRVVRVLHHAINSGEGAALKSGINCALSEFPGLLGLVTADADGQHRSEDVRKVASCLAHHPESLILGSRALTHTASCRTSVATVCCE